MQQWSSQADSWPLRKIRRDPRAFLHKRYAPEFLPFSRVNFYPHVAQGSQRLRHHPFSARLVNGRRRAIRDGYLEPLLARGNRGRQPRRASANDEYVCTSS